MIYVAIDPGLTGAVAALTAEGTVKLCADLPVMRFGKLAWCDGEELVAMLATCCRSSSLADPGPTTSTMIERAQPMPRQGVSSVFAYGVVFGSIVQAMHWTRLDFVAPAKWKRDMGVSADKTAAIDRARMLFPTVPLRLKRDHNRAEALLIAEWHRRSDLGIARVRVEQAAAEAEKSARYAIDYVNELALKTLHEEGE